MDDITLSETRDFVEQLPEISANETFCFDCSPEVPCFNRCCAELTLPLTPYDVLRLTRHLQMSAEDFLTTYTNMQTIPETGFPFFTLRMNQEPGEPCPFVSPGGCMVYENRPSACRAYPLGRGTRLGNDGTIERFFMVREEHCHGFDNGTERTPAQWFETEELLPYNQINDRYMRLMSLVQASGKPLDTRLQGMARLCLFHIQAFRQMINKMRIMSHLDLSMEARQKIFEESLDGETACLEFGLDWMELVIFGEAERLKRTK